MVVGVGGVGVGSGVVSARVCYVSVLRVSCVVCCVCCVLCLCSWLFCGCVCVCVLSGGGVWGSFSPSLQAKDARKHMACLITTLKVANSDDMVGLADDHKRALTGKDASFTLELGLIAALCGATAEARVSAIIFRMLPSKDRELSIVQSEQQVQGFLGKDGIKLIPSVIQVGVKFLVTMFGAIKNGTTHTLHIHTMSKFVKECWSRCGHFLRVKNDKGEIITAAEAMLLVCEKLEAPYTAKKQLDPMEDDIALCGQYRWLVPSCHDKMVADILRTRKAAAKACAKASAAASSSSGPPAKKAKRNKAEEAAAGAAKYFR